MFVSEIKIDESLTILVGSKIDSFWRAVVRSRNLSENCQRGVVSSLLVLCVFYMFIVSYTFYYVSACTVLCYRNAIIKLLKRSSLLHMFRAGI